MRRRGRIWRVGGSGPLEGERSLRPSARILTGNSGGRMCVGSHLAVYRESNPVKCVPWWNRCLVPT